jgi:hypothetical protein
MMKLVLDRQKYYQTIHRLQGNYRRNLGQWGVRPCFRLLIGRLTPSQEAL